MRLTIPSVLAVALALGTTVQAKGAEEAKAKKPILDIRATPRMAFSPVNILFTAELTGGDDVEDYYCPELEWEWDEGVKSVHESDCPEFEPGVTKIERRFTAEHQFLKAGNYTIKVTMRRANRVLTQRTIKVTVRPGLGDTSMEGPGQP